MQPLGPRDGACLWSPWSPHHSKLPPHLGCLACCHKPLSEPLELQNGRPEALCSAAPEGAPLVLLGVHGLLPASQPIHLSCVSQPCTLSYTFLPVLPQPPPNLSPQGAHYEALLQSFRRDQSDSPNTPPKRAHQPVWTPPFTALCGERPLPASFLFSKQRPHPTPNQLPSLCAAMQRRGCVKLSLTDRVGNLVQGLLQI